MSPCRGFTHPMLLLVRSSVNTKPAQTALYFLRPRCFSSTAGLTRRYQAPKTAEPRLGSMTKNTGAILKEVGIEKDKLEKARLENEARENDERLGKVKAEMVRMEKSKTPATATPARRNESTATKVAGSTASPRSPSALSFEQRLAQNPGGTVLYEGPPSRIFLFSSYAAGLMCLGAGSFNILFNFYNAPPDIAAWVPWCFAALGMVLAGMATFFFSVPAGVVRSIRVLPGTSPVRLEVTIRRFFAVPGIPPKRIEVAPRDVTFRTRLYRPVTEPAGYEKFRAEQINAKLRDEKRKYEMENLYTAPFRDAAWAGTTVWQNFRRALTSEGLMPIAVGGKKYKLDVSGGYLLDQGRALDRIVRIERTPEVSPLGIQT